MSEEVQEKSETIQEIPVKKKHYKKLLGSVFLANPVHRTGKIAIMYGRFSTGSRIV